MISLSHSAFRRLSALALAEAGLDLQEGKHSFVASRLQKRLHATGAPNFEAYASLVEGDDPAAAEERSHLISALTTNVTSVFREPHHFALLARALLRLDRGPLDPLRLWSAGCSTGEETLSMAMTCRCVFGSRWTDHARILATDIDYVSLSIAKSQFGDPSLSVALREGADAALRGDGRTPEIDISHLQAGITYLRHSLIEPLPVPRPFDVIFCRNVTIYFAPEIQRAVQADLIERLAPNGLLCLGHSERLLLEDRDLQRIGHTSYAGQSSPIAETIPCR